MDQTIRQAQAKDPDAIRRLVVDLYPRVYAFCARRVGPNDAPDIAQETFLTMHAKIGDYAHQAPFLTWLLGIANNHCRNHAKKHNQDPYSLENWLQEPTDHPRRPDLAQNLALQFDLHQALAALSPEHRQAVLLHEIEGLTYQEIADLAQIPLGTVKSRLYNAFRHLRELLANPQQNNPSKSTDGHLDPNRPAIPRPQEHHP